MKEVIVFVLGGKQYGIEISGMQSLEKYQNIQPFPDAPEFILGTIKIRDVVIPVFDINRMIGLPASQPVEEQQPEKASAEHRKILLLRTLAGTMGCVVDGVENVFRAEGGDVQPMPPMMKAKGTEFLDFIIRRDNKLIVVIQPRFLFTDEQLTMIKKIDFSKPEKEEEPEAEPEDKGEAEAENKGEEKAEAEPEAEDKGEEKVKIRKEKKTEENKEAVHKKTDETKKKKAKKRNRTAKKKSGKVR